LARLDDIEGRQGGKTAGLVIACFVFEIAEAVELVPCVDEVHDALWVPLRDLADPGRLVRYEHPTIPHPYPGVRLDEGRVVWGLTYRFLGRMLQVLGHELPEIGRFARVADPAPTVGGHGGRGTGG